MSKKDNAAAANAPVVKKAAASASGRYMYVGPNRLKDGLRTNQVFIGMPDALISPLKEKYPGIGRLFLPIEDLGQTGELSKVGSPLYLAFKELER